MTIYGFCLAEQADVEIGPDRRCPHDGTPCIPPSWGRHTQRWQDGRWAPEIARPEGYQYRPPAYLRGSTNAPPVQHRCERCRAPITAKTSGGSLKRFCTKLCKRLTAQDRRRERKAGVAA